jgi:hypothetical protein
MLLQFRKNLIAYLSWRMCHGYSQIKDKLLNFTEHITFPIVSKVLKFFFCNTGCSALGRA